jgi:hypothetical protein
MSMRRLVVLGVLACAPLVACSGGTSVPPAPSSVHDGGVLEVVGQKGVAFTLTLGTGVPSGETLTLSPNVGALPSGAIDGFAIHVGAQAFPVGAFFAMTLHGQPAEADGYFVNFELQSGSDFQTLWAPQADGGTFTPVCPPLPGASSSISLAANTSYFVVLTPAFPVECPAN